MERKRPRFWNMLAIMMVITCFTIVTTVSAGSGDDSDASYPEVGVEWICTYQWPSADLPNSDDCAIGFYTTLGDAGWTQSFNRGTYTSEVDHWVADGSDSSYVDGVDIVMFAGHGANDLIKIATARWAWFNCCEWGITTLNGCCSAHVIQLKFQGTSNRLKNGH
jgi:hypothetical protein